VASDPGKYSEAFLGKPNEEYCAWILDSEKWGGLLNFAFLISGGIIVHKM
jgi:ubiquitin thioesterase OTU1